MVPARDWPLILLWLASASIVLLFAWGLCYRISLIGAGGVLGP